MTETFFQNSHVKFEVLRPHKIVELTMTTQDYGVLYCRIWEHQLPYFIAFVNGRAGNFEVSECVWDVTNRNLDVTFTLRGGNLIIDAVQTEDDTEDEFWTFVVESDHVPVIFDKIQSTLKG